MLGTNNVRTLGAVLAVAAVTSALWTLNLAGPAGALPPSQAPTPSALQTTDQKIDALTGQVRALTQTVNQINNRTASMNDTLATVKDELTATKDTVAGVRSLANGIARSVSTLYESHRLNGLVICLYRHDIRGQDCPTGT